MKFSEVVRTYSAYQRSQGKKSSLSESQIKELARMVKSGEITEATIAKANASLAKRESRNSSVARHSVRRPMRQESARTTSTAKRPLTIEESRVKALYEQALASRRNLNEKRTGSRFVTLKEKEAIHSRVRLLVEKHTSAKKPMVEAKRNRPNNRVNFSEKSMNRAFYGIRSKIREARVALREDDINAATNAVQDATSQLNGLPATGADVPENIKSGVQNLKTQIDDLAVQCGIQPATDLGGDPNAQIPSVTGIDPNAATDMGGDMGAQQTFESHKDIRARIRERNALLRKMNEGLGDTPNNMTPGEMGAGVVTTFGTKVVKANDESQLKTAPLGTMTSGSEKKSIKWPNKPISNLKEPKNIAENQSLTDKAITEFLNKKQFSFQDLYKESNGILG